MDLGASLNKLCEMHARLDIVGDRVIGPMQRGAKALKVFSRRQWADHDQRLEVGHVLIFACAERAARSPAGTDARPASLAFSAISVVADISCWARYDFGTPEARGNGYFSGAATALGGQSAPESASVQQFTGIEETSQIGPLPWRPRFGGPRGTARGGRGGGNRSSSLPRVCTSAEGTRPHATSPFPNSRIPPTRQLREGYIYIKVSRASRLELDGTKKNKKRATRVFWLRSACA